MTVITVSRNELTRLRVLIDISDGRLSVEDATGLIGVGRRQIYRLLDAFRARGPESLISRKRGRPSNRALGTVFRETVLAIVRERYADFGPTPVQARGRLLAAEKLSEVHGLDLGVETLRQWMIGAGLWVRRKDRLQRIHQPRARRDCLGELVQIDGSEHWWFEDRGPQSTLLVYVDDATSRLMHLKLVETESTFDYFQATREYLEAHGKPVAFYSDKHGVFRVNQTGAIGGDGMTQFGRALHALNIDIICANSSHAKGRVERANKTLQDRLVKELRLQGIGTIAAGNKMLPSFLADYNARFGKEPRNSKDLHRPLLAGDDLTEVFTWREERTVSNSLTLQYDKVVFLLEPNEITRELRRKRVTVVDYPDGRLAIRYRGLDLPYTTFDKLRQVSQTTIVENKHLGAVLAHIRKRQIARAEARSHSAPRRQGQVGHMFKVG
jgi:Helix-turn-helix domain